MPLTFDHVAQVVPDIAEAVAFYTALLPDAIVLHADQSWAFLDAGGVKLAFVLKDQHPNHLAWRVSEAELLELAEKHKKEIHPHRDGTRSFYLDAPGGGHIEIITFDGSTWPSP